MNNHLPSINVLFVIGSLPIGGAENQVVTLAKTLNSDRYKMYVCCLRREGVQASFLKSAGIPVVALNMRRRTWPVAMFRLYKLIKKIKPQILHTHLYEADIWARLVGIFAGVPIIVTTLHGMIYWRKINKIPIINHLLNRFTDKVIACSDPIRQSYLKLSKTSPEHIVFIPNTVDLRRFSGVKDRNEIRAQLGADLRTALIGTVARLVPEKRIDHLLEAARIVCDAVPQARFVIIGMGALLNELKEQALKLDLYPKLVTFIDNCQDASDYLSALDIYALSSETEGIPVALLEAMAASVAVVATSVGGVPQVIEDGENGLLVPRHDPAGLAKAILKLLENPSLRASIAQNGYQTILSRHSTEVVGQQIADIYESLIKEKSSRLNLKNSEQL